ncbi:MAG: hypothetical protein ACR2NI_01550, partial [Pirellulales bacterium]
GYCADSITCFLFSCSSILLTKGRDLPSGVMTFPELTGLALVEELGILYHSEFDAQTAANFL